MDLLLRTGVGRFLLNGTELGFDTPVYAEGGVINFAARSIAQQRLLTKYDPTRTDSFTVTAAVIYSIYTV